MRCSAAQGLAFDGMNEEKRDIGCRTERVLPMLEVDGPPRLIKIEGSFSQG